MAIAKWYKIDFHTHTPESRCFKDKNVTPTQWLNAAKSAGLDAVVITDHNSVGFISQINQIQSNSETKIDLKVFYGIELCVSADFTHIIIIFDDKLTVTEIEDAVIGYLGLKRADWTNTEVNVSEDQLKKLCTEFKDRIFVIPAHIASNKGLAKSNINAIKKYQEFISFSAYEVRNDDDLHEYENKLSQKVINSATLISGSDNPSNKDSSVHSVEGFGKMFTWIKTAGLSFEGLRQVFIDPENRCINYLRLQEIGIDFDPNEITYNYVGGISLSNISHMNDLNMRFSAGLNCIVGSRGTGKSTLVDAIHYGLDSSYDLSKCILLNKTLLKGGCITTYFNFGTNNTYTVKAIRNNKVLEYTYENNSAQINNPPEFKIDFYGQKEIYNLIENDDNEINETSPLVKMIDERMSSQLFAAKDEIDNAISNMQNYAKIYQDNLKKIRELPTVNAEIAKSEAILSRFKASGIEETRKKYEYIDNMIKLASKSISSYSEYIDEQIKTIQRKRDDYGISFAKLHDDSTQNSDAIDAINQLLASCDNLCDTFLQEQKKLCNTINQFNSSEIHSKATEIKSIYMDSLETLKSTGIEDIQFIQERLQKNSQRKIELEELQTQQEKIITTLQECIASFVSTRLNLTNMRRKTTNQIKTDGIKISISSISYKERWKTHLQREFVKESYDDEFMQISEYVLAPQNDFENYKKFLFFVLTSTSGELTELYHNSLQQRFLNLWRDKAKNNTLASLANVIPEDKVEISIIENGNEIDINEGSPGQKCAALLAFILNTGENPLIIDQPEDDLDNSLIYNLVVKSIREMKNKRQIIIVTHNPNIPVLGDAEGIIILERDKNGKVNFRNGKKAGCLEEIEIRKGICDIMEGGEDAFRKREAKYLHCN